MGDPDFKGTLVNLGAAYLRLQQYNDAIAVSESLNQRYPDAAQGYYHIAVACYQQAFSLQACLTSSQATNYAKNEDEKFKVEQEIQRLRYRASFELQKSRETDDGRLRCWPKEDVTMINALSTG